jgi:hypothetical protein
MPANFFDIWGYIATLMGHGMIIIDFIFPTNNHYYFILITYGKSQNVHRNWHAYCYYHNT